MDWRELVIVFVIFHRDCSDQCLGCECFGTLSEGGDTLITVNE